ncbi:MAG TPA: acetyl-CoA carboxylase carboxyl transferase subunit beta [Fibrobacteres bacterium]|nr:acetyl-CoA carboxylase carboxyl transferase subunit beta [Fibrobacterota bacterium]
MEWFRKAKSGIGTFVKKDTPVDLWVKCEGCKEVLYRKELAQNLNVCQHCGHHFRVGAGEYVKLLIDEGTWQPMDANLRSVDPLKFAAKKKYSASLADAEKNTGTNSGVLSGTGDIESRKIALGVMDFRFIGGSMGSVEGEKIARVFRKALALKVPAVIVSASGGARMQEGVLSLMQMANTSACIAQLNEAKLPFISVLTNPTMGGVTASFAMLGDVHIAEPGALIGFAGERVIRETIRQALPPGFQRAEFLMEKGFVDLIVARPALRETIARILSHFG